MIQTANVRSSGRSSKHNMFPYGSIEKHIAIGVIVVRCVRGDIKIAEVCRLLSMLVSAAVYCSVINHIVNVIIIISFVQRR